mgnify:CR=1 FL=1
MSIQELIKKQVDGNRVVLYMKGTPDFPQCIGRMVPWPKAIGQVIQLRLS